MDQCKNARLSYLPPSVRKLTPEEAEAFLRQKASEGDQGARDLLSLIFTEPDADQK